MLQDSLWQERYVVKASGILNKLAKDEILLQEVLQSQQKGLQKYYYKYS